MHRTSHRTLVAVAVFVLLLVPIAAFGVGPTFIDVPATDWAYTDIEWLAATGVTKGCAPDRYCPDDPVTRREMAAFLHRLAIKRVVDAGTLDGHDSTDFTGNDGYSVHHNASIAIPTDWTTLLELPNLPAGSYLFIAKTWLKHEGASGGQYARCQLTAGSDYDSTVGTVAGPGDGIPATWTVVHTFTNPTNTAYLECKDVGYDVTLNDTKITGIRLDSVTNQAG